MKKGKSISLLSIIGILMAFLIVMTFVPFSMGVKNYNSVLGAIELDYDLAGGYAYEISLADDNIEEVDDINAVVNTIEYRLEELGHSTYSIKAIRPEGHENEDYKLRIEARGKINKYGEQDIAGLTQDITVATQYGELSFYGDASANPGADKQILTEGKVIESAKYTGATSNEGVAYYQTTVTFTKYAFDEIIKNIESNDGSYYLTIKLGDQDLFSGSSAIQKEYFNGRSIVITTSDESVAIRNALLINSGGLAYKFNAPEDPVEITSVYGENFASKLAISIGIAFALVAFLFLILYKGLGLSFALSSILFVIIELAMLIAVPGISLSIAGVVGIVTAGIILFDGQVVIARRLKEEFANGKTVKSSISNAMRRALVPVLGTGILSGVVGLLVFIFAKGGLACFGITLGIGSVVALISNLLFVRMFNSLILPLNGYSEKFLGLKRTEEKETL